MTVEPPVRLTHECPDGGRPGPPNRVAVAEKVAESWNGARIDYAVAHGLENYPAGLGRDLDVIVKDDQLERAAGLTVDVFRTLGWAVVKHQKPWALWIFGFRRGTSGFESLEIDLIPRLQWGPVVLVEGGASDETTGPFRTDTWARLVKRHLMSLLGGAYGGEVGSARREPATEAELKASEQRLEALFGSHLAGRLILALRTDDRAELQNLRGRLCRSLVQRAVMRRPRLAMSATLVWMRDEIALAYAKPCAPVIALVGPDGIGKSTSIEHLRSYGDMPFTGLVAKHWRPGLLPSLNRLIRGTRADADAPCPPRRNPGRFQALRLAYYALDFVLGSRLTDRRRSSLLGLTLYDRCGLDMSVDPMRYGLKSSWGTGILWRLTAKPDAVILFWDDPSNIVRRKKDLGRAEIARQFNAWLSLLEEGKVDAVIDASAGPTEVGECVTDIVLDRFRRKNIDMTAPRQGTEASLEWFGSIMTRSPAGFRLERDRLRGNGAGSHDDLLFVSTFARIPGDGAPRILLERPVVGGDLVRGIYNPQRAIARVAVGVCSRLLRTGLGKRGLLDSISLCVPRRVAQEEYKKIFLQDHLRQVLDLPRMSVAVALGRPGAHRKPVLLIGDGDGYPRAYAKIGWDTKSVSLLLNEEKILRKLEGQVFSTATVPRVIHSGWWNDRFVLLLKAPEGATKSSPSELREEHVRFLLELGQIGSRNDGARGEDVSLRLRERLATIRKCGFQHYANLVARALEIFCSPIVDIPVGFKHGDFAPWNTLMLGSRLLVFDWEHADDAAPRGWDLFHFVIQTSVLLRHDPLPRIINRLLSDSETTGAVRTYFERSTLTDSIREQCLALYLCDILTWSVIRDGDVVSRKDRRLRQIWAQLLAVLLLRKETGAW